MIKKNSKDSASFYEVVATREGNGEYVCRHAHVQSHAKHPSEKWELSLSKLLLELKDKSRHLAQMKRKI